MDQFQFYPTPTVLAAHCWAKFKNKKFVRVMEPQAGHGDLALANPFSDRYGRHGVQIDCCEIDMSKHDVLRAKGLNVVGIDFLNFGNLNIYSHVIMNPPFADGVKHVLKAWDALWDGEIVAIINAETVRNPFSAERKHLARVIEEFGDVEFVTGAFSLPDAERKTDVDIAIVYLRKSANIDSEIIGAIIKDLQQDTSPDMTGNTGFKEEQSVMLPNSTIENMVLTFDAAVRTMKDAVISAARSRYYSALLGDTMEVVNASLKAVSETEKPLGFAAKLSSAQYVQQQIFEGYSDLKNRAWTGLLRSTNVTTRLSSAAKKQMEKQFDDIKSLEFTISNIHGFLHGLAMQGGTIQLQMACDVFDLITKYHTDNVVFYKGWVSNSRQRTCGMRVKASRFVLPTRSYFSPKTSIGSDAEQFLADFDKVFAMLDGKVTPEISLTSIFNNNMRSLVDGVRHSSSYFDVRYYPGAKTIHFFPKSKELMDRLNRTVGRQRNWLPAEDTRVSADFWTQYDKADKLDKEVRSEIEKNKNPRSYHDDPLRGIGSNDEQERDRAMKIVDEATTTVLERHGISIEYRIEKAQNTFLLEAA